jgi:AraC family transcriptional regulator, regulatory protein of adaptative response / methylated-DNA-[protein]-cysteine methyltransferase
MSNNSSDYDTIASVIGYIAEHPKANLSLEQLADFVSLSPTQLQKTFTNWCGISPKQFQRYLSLEYAKTLLQQNQSNMQTSIITGLSSTGRLHDLFVDIEAMTPGEYKHGGALLTIAYSIHTSRFGLYLIASTTKGICNILFIDQAQNPIELLQQRWPNAQLVSQQNTMHEPVIQFFAHQNPAAKIKLHLHGTNYQLKVWRALLSIPEGQITSYGALSKSIGDTSSLGSRAAGTAIGNNPIAYLIPCHRVLKSTGQISGYRWGLERKQALLGWEATKIQDSSITM